MMGSENPKSCTPTKDSFRKGSEGGSEGVRRRVRNSLNQVRNLAPLLRIRLAGCPKVGPKFGPKGSEGDQKDRSSRLGRDFSHARICCLSYSMFHRPARLKQLIVCASSHGA